MALSPASQLATYSERFYSQFVLAQLINTDWRPDFENGKGGTTNIQIFHPGLTGKGSDIGSVDGRKLKSTNIAALMEQYYGAVSLSSIEQTTLVEDFEKAIEPTLASHIYDIEMDIRNIINSAVSHVSLFDPARSTLPDIVAQVIGLVKSNSLESQVNVAMSPELMSVMASKLLDKFNASTPALDAFEGRIRRWQGASDIGASIAMTGFSTGNVPEKIAIDAPSSPTNTLTLTTATTNAFAKGTISINLGKIGYDPIRKATGKDLIVVNAEDIPVGGTTFKLSFILTPGVTCSALPSAGEKLVTEQANKTYGEIYVFRKGAIGGRAGVLSGHSVGKLNVLPKNGGIPVRRWQFSEGQQDVETVRFDVLFAAAPVYPVGVAKILVPM